jgi:hypothetical protein
VTAIANEMEIVGTKEKTKQRIMAGVALAS